MHQVCPTSPAAAIAPSPTCRHASSRVLMPSSSTDKHWRQITRQKQTARCSNCVWLALLSRLLFPAPAGMRPVVC
jgi:hypothetical protein